MKFLLAAFIIFSTQAIAAPKHFEIICEGANIHYINQFDTSLTLEFDEEVLENVSIKAKMRKAGYESETEEVEFNNLTATVERIFKPEVFGKAFHIINIRSEKDASKEFFANIILGYPGRLTSFLRLEGIRQYKSTCKLVE